MRKLYARPAPIVMAAGAGIVAGRPPGGD